MIITSEISEYDIAHAGISILYEAGKITRERYDFLVNLEKKKRVVETGYMLKEDKTLYPVIKAGYEKYTGLLMKDNKLNSDHIVEIVNDAIWVKGKALTKLEYGEVRFRKKRTFDITYVFEKKNIRFYYSLQTGALECRGSKLNTVSKMYHFIKRVFKLYDMGDKVKLYNTLHKCKAKLDKDQDAMGSDLCNGLSNRKIIIAFIRDLINR